jgi:hypothetical protein
MAREDITVVYTGGGAKLRAYIRLAEDDAPLKPAKVQEDIRHIELTEDDVDSEKFTKLLEDNARATDFLSLWCYYPVWLKLLKLLDVRQPLPPTARWPLQSADHAE